MRILNDQLGFLRGIPLHRLLDCKRHQEKLQNSKPAAQQGSKQNCVVKLADNRKNNHHDDAHDGNTDGDIPALVFDCRFNLDIPHHQSR